MGKYSAKNKIYLGILVWLVLVGSMFGYFFGIINTSNTAVIQKIADGKKQLKLLQVQLSSFNLAKQDLKTLKEQPYQPDNFFSRDVTLVNEIKTLEGLGQKYNVQLSIGGVSGTINNAPKAKTQGSIVFIPYSLTLTGPLSNAVDFIETLENLSFVTNVDNVNISGAGGGDVNVSLAAYFYLRK